MTIVIVLISLAILILLIAWVRLNPSAAYMMDIKKEPGKIVEAIAAYVNNREQP